MGWGNKGTYDKERNLTYSDKGTYGTSGFMDDVEMLQVLELVSDITKSRGSYFGIAVRKSCMPAGEHADEP